MCEQVAMNLRKIRPQFIDCSQLKKKVIHVGPRVTLLLPRSSMHPRTL